MKKILILISILLAPSICFSDGIEYASGTQDPLSASSATLGSGESVHIFNSTIQARVIDVWEIWVSTIRGHSPVRFPGATIFGDTVTATSQILGSTISASQINLTGPAGGESALMNISSGTFKLFEITGTSTTFNTDLYDGRTGQRIVIGGAGFDPASTYTWTASQTFNSTTTLLQSVTHSSMSYFNGGSTFTAPVVFTNPVRFIGTQVYISNNWKTVGTPPIVSNELLTLSNNYNNTTAAATLVIESTGGTAGAAGITFKAKGSAVHSGFLTYNGSQQIHIGDSSYAGNEDYPGISVELAGSERRVYVHASGAVKGGGMKGMLNVYAGSHTVSGSDARIVISSDPNSALPAATENTAIQYVKWDSASGHAQMYVAGSSSETPTQITGKFNTSTIAVQGQTIFMSSTSATDYDGYTIFYATGDIIANGTVIINGASVNGGANGTVKFGWPTVSDVSDGAVTVNTIQIVPPLTSGMTSFSIRNVDAVNTRGFTLSVPYRKQ